MFLIQLTNYLGFFPKINEGAKYFDLREGTFVRYEPTHPMYVSENTSKSILALLNTKLDGSDQPVFNLQTRRRILHEMLNYYRILFDHFKDLQSLAVLEATFHD